MSEKPLILEQSIPANPARVWQAITQHGEMRAWFFEQITDFRAEPGFSTRFEVQADSAVFLHHWEIMEVIPEQKIVYRWLYPDYPGASFVTFELSPKGAETVLQIRHEGMQSFPQEVPEFRPESCRAGWEYFSNRLARWLAEEK